MNIIIAPSWPQNLPKQLGAVCWYDACRPGALASGNKVSSWTDLSGNGYHATQGTDANRPTWMDATQHGRPVIAFSPANYSQLSTSAWSFPVGTKVSTICVCKSTRSATLSSAVFNRQSEINVRNPGLYMGVTSGGLWVHTHGKFLLGNESTVASSASYDAIPVIALGTHDRTLSTNETNGWINGTQSTTRSPNEDTTGTMGSSVLTIGWSGTDLSSNWRILNGWVGELAMFDFILSAEQMARLHQYLSQKWGIKLA